MLITPAIIGQGSKRRSLADVSVTALGLYSTTVDATTPSFAGCNFGTASEKRGIYCAVFGDRVSAGSVTCDAVTIGGIPARRECAAGIGFNNRNISFWSALVPTGSSGNVDVTFSDSVTVSGIYLWNAINLLTINAWKGPYAIGDSSADPLGTTLVVPKGGAVLAFYVKLSPSAPASGWTGISEDLALVAIDPPGNSTLVSAGSEEFATAQAALAVNYDMPAGNSLTGFAALVLR